MRGGGWGGGCGYVIGRLMTDLTGRRRSPRRWRESRERRESERERVREREKERAREIKEVKDKGGM